MSAHHQGSANTVALVCPDATILSVTHCSFAPCKLQQPSLATQCRASSLHQDQRVAFAASLSTPVLFRDTMKICKCQHLRDSVGSAASSGSLRQIHFARNQGQGIGHHASRLEGSGQTAPGFTCLNHQRRARGHGTGRQQRFPAPNRCSWMPHQRFHTTTAHHLL